mmetsp:Transcript_23693/g.60045  ORF Transcript_23693/g.60045 Transcript_23693/m.60045 type:complete len:260 (+) Transcript_23693:92-871(+)
MASRRAIALAAGAATTAIAAAGSHDAAECNAVSPSMSMSFEVITAGEIEDVSRQLGVSSAKDGSMSGSGIIELRDLGNGWVSAPDEATTRSVLALGKDLARDPRVQAAVLERIRGGPSALANSSKLLEELKLVLVSREVAADGTHSTATASPLLSRCTSAENLANDKTDAQDTQQADSKQEGPQADAQADAKPEEEEEPSLGAALLEAAIIIASVIILAVVARRINAKAVAMAGAALASAWCVLMAPFDKDANGKKRGA